MSPRRRPRPRPRLRRGRGLTLPPGQLSRPKPFRIPAVVLLLAAGGVCGIGYNLLAPRGIFATQPKGSLVSGPWSLVKENGSKVAGLESRVKETPKENPVAVSGAPVVLGLEEARKVWQEKSALWVDARPPASFAMAHVPGALNIPASGFEAGYRLAAARLAKASRVLVYCTGNDCEESDLVLKGLAGKGFRNLLHFKDGWNAWENADFPQEKGPGTP